MSSEIRTPGEGKKVGLLGVPLGYAAGQAGSELGVDAMRLSRIRGHVLMDHIRGLGYDVTDYGNSDIARPEAPADEHANPKYLEEMVASCKNIANDVKQILSHGGIPVILGGDHSIAIGSVAGVASHFRESA